MRHDGAVDDVARRLAGWAVQLAPSEADFELATRSLVDTLAVTLAARDDEIRGPAVGLSDAGRWAALGHVLDFDDLHVESTTHISVVCVPAALTAGGGARAYLAGAGVMARLGNALGWQHYTRGWHATCTAGAPAAAAAAAVAMGLDEERVATAIALAVPAAGGVQRAFGSHAKSLQVAFAVEAGVRAAALSARGATADPRALDDWLQLMGASDVVLDGPAVPGGLAVKVFPCCYALQRPIAAVRSAGISPDEVVGARVRTPRASVQPLIHSRPRTGLEGKFSLEYSIATALLDGFPTLASFTDTAVVRPEARRLTEAVTVELTEDGERGLLDGTCTVTFQRADGSEVSSSLDIPPGAPGCPLPAEDLAAKVRSCAPDLGDELLSVTWEAAPDLLKEHLPV